ncbi:3-isopropylmalate dehydrogenase [Sediminitomix flava]|uniref:3-isopropylmalate dehydrogenase n=1 Tax=Sediminitomix flava TaxID=379075 RepID=A0A315ZJZ0_SEDFL|nr:3-isopropylmalate dehydrogenase [Sediminitomix flava]PWJ45004.1 3-isopropylmalate dehydrogenase [Sediminitomix flava]
MATKNIAVLAGDGIGPEVVAQGIKVLDAVAEVFGHTFNYTEALVGAVAIDATGNPLPEETLEVCKASDAVFFGAIGHPKYDNDPNAKVRPEQGLLALRKSLGLFANIRPVTTFEALIHKSPLKEEKVRGADLVVYRELTGGIYFGEKGRNEKGDEAYDNCAYSTGEIERIAKLAFEAAQNRRKKLTLVDKANVLETSRLWREVVRGMASSYPDVEVDYMFVDNAAMQLIQWPSQFDVILTENMFGDIISDEASVLTGSMGLLPSASIGAKVGMYEPIHGSYPQAAGQDIANPMATVLSAAMLLDGIGMYTEGNAVRTAVDKAISENYVTEDLDKEAAKKCSEVGDYLAELVKANVQESI